ncbi:MAG: serine/threonine-protein kinase [Gemmatales bacterium]|nr:serine/threonine protein kinase [Gemmatales bacterium]MCS7160856.1 serine/threonine protein kinase [Gemmatales bacterium]MDW8176058.1 serine/threonine-protein kinase [Gemmatales bacterium]MDW8221647.1 serine/threonine-protein kinase [Gemmatales bacterium]
MASDGAVHSAQLEEQRLLHALITRGLISEEEVRECRNVLRQGHGVSDLLRELIKQGYLTVSQGRRVLRNLDTLLEQQIPGYLLLEKLGEGSMGAVYKARQISVDRLVAVKILKSSLAQNAGYIQRFLREAKIAAQLSSNNIVQAIDAGVAGSIYYFVMEYVEGRTIKQELDSGRVFDEKEAVEIVLQVAQALEHAHRRGLVHRDVKPANIIITRDGLVKLADLGLARQIHDRELDKLEKDLTIGTPFYIAPELIQLKTQPDIRADIYSLGATLYHMVTGQPPFPYKNVRQVLIAQLREKPKPPDQINPDLSPGLCEVIERMMAKNRERRYHTPAGVIVDLECLLRGEPPKLAHEASSRQQQRVEALKSLADSEVVETDTWDVQYEPPKSSAWSNLAWIGLFLLSLVLNIYLLFFSK